MRKTLSTKVAAGGAYLRSFWAYRAHLLSSNIEVRSRLNLRSRASKKDKAIIINDHLWMRCCFFSPTLFCNLETLGSFSSTQRFFWETRWWFQRTKNCVKCPQNPRFSNLLEDTRSSLRSLINENVTWDKQAMPHVAHQATRATKYAFPPASCTFLAEHTTAKGREAS